MTKIKICGLRRKEDIGIINRYHPDFAGFILAENRKRTISEEQLETLRKMLDPDIQSVAVFVNQDVSYPAEIFHAGLADYIQLHGSEDEAYIHALRKEAPGVRIIQAFSISEESDIRNAEKSSADLILLDHGKGGTGSSFDWKLICHMKRPFLLAGGLNAQNITAAISVTHPYAVDASSGVETNGYKDEKKIRELMKAVREGDIDE